MPSEIYHTVPKLDQHSLFPNVSYDDNMACWYTSGLMVLLHKIKYSANANMANLNSLLNIFRNNGIEVPTPGGKFYSMYDFAKEVGLESNPGSILLCKKNEEDYATTLQKTGPLWTPVNYMISNGEKRAMNHIIVLTGCTKAVSSTWQISYNDPWNGTEKTNTVSEMNQMVSWEHPMLYRTSTYYLKST
jgi:hypothetical protein